MKATAGESNSSFLYCTASEFVEIYVGMGQKRVRELFDQARKCSPCIIFIDEIDGIGMRRERQWSGDQGGADQERSATLNQVMNISIYLMILMCCSNVLWLIVF